MEYRVQVEPDGQILHLKQGTVLLDALRKAGFWVDAPCGGHGTCGKCRLTVEGREVWACQYEVHSDLTVSLPTTARKAVPEHSAKEAYGDPLYAAFDIGTTTVVCFVLDPSGKTLAGRSMHNSQKGYGADVITRIDWAMKGEREALTLAVRKGMENLLMGCCSDAGVSPTAVKRIGVVGNSCMQQLFFGMDVDNLAAIPFSPIITQAKLISASDIFSCCPDACITVVPDISGYVGADTLACVLALKLHEQKETVLLVDIGTNGEMVLCHKGRMVACATAAGPALEGANISCGMRAIPGAIDRVSPEGVRVLGGGEAVGICGSGLIDAAAVMLNQGVLNSRGRIQTPDRTYPLTDRVRLTQEDIRQLQLAKGAICAGIHLMAEYFGITVSEIDRCMLSGAFGTSLDPESACSIGLLPSQLLGKTEAVGNAAGEGAKLLALYPGILEESGELIRRIEYLELAQLPNFRRWFARCMGFEED